MKQLKIIILLSIVVIIIGIGAALTLKVAIGVGPWDSLAQSTSYLFGMKVGTMGIILNCICVLGQWILLKKYFNYRHLLQVPLSILIGYVVNFFFYDVLELISIDGYMMKLTVFIAAIIILAFALACMLVLNIVTFPLEGFCMALANKTKWKFAVIRQLADIFNIILGVLLSFGLSLPLTLREGTIICMLMFAPLIGYFMGRIQPIFRKLELINDEVENIEVVKKDSLKIV